MSVLNPEQDEKVRDGTERKGKRVLLQKLPWLTAQFRDIEPNIAADKVPAQERREVY